MNLATGQKLVRSLLFQIKGRPYPGQGKSGDPHHLGLLKKMRAMRGDDNENDKFKTERAG